MEKKNNGFLAPGMLKKYWLTFFATLSNSAFLITMLSQTFYVQFQEVYNLTNTQLGFLEGIGSIGGFIGGFVGGFFADGFSPRNLTALGCVVAFAAAVAEALSSSYFVLILVYIALSFSSNVLLMTPYFKLLKLLGTDEEQGKIMTFSETAYAIVTLLINYGFLGAISAFNLSFQAALIAVGAINGLVAIGIYGLFRAPGLTREEDRLKKEALERKNSRGAKDAGVEKTRGNALTEFISVLKMPILWLNVAATMTMTFYNQVVFTYMNPYLVNVLGIAAATASLLQITFRNSLRIVISPFGGTIRDKLNDSTAVVKWFSFGLAAVMLCFALFGAASLYAYLALVVLAGICIYSVTGLQYTLIADAKVPIKYSGRVWGIVFGLNTLTTLFRGTVCGSLLDIQGTDGYRTIFLIGLGSCLLCALSAILIRKVIDSGKALGRDIQAQVDAGTTE